MRSVTILGSTGSVGTATLDVIRANPDMFSVHALTAHKNVDLLARQAKESNAKLAVIADENLYAPLKDALAGTGIKAAAGRATVVDAAAEGANCTMAAIMGMAGLEPLLAAVACGKNVAIANKEPLVAAGKIVLDAAQKFGANILPVDSEHNAIFQCLQQDNAKNIHRIILTASGGPFRAWSMEQMRVATREQALAHPNWSMGRKISIDSATMMNKALEVIEAHHLFNLPPEKIEVVIHPQSTIHSMVEYKDGSTLAQLGVSDMRVPIAHALAWPERAENSAGFLNFATIRDLTFEPVDDRRFPAINYAYHCLKEGQSACIAFNAANEVAVEAFLTDQIGFLDIFDIVHRMVEDRRDDTIETLEDVVAFDSNVRDATLACIVDYKPLPRKVS